MSGTCTNVTSNTSRIIARQYVASLGPGLWIVAWSVFVIDGRIRNIEHAVSTTTSVKP